jgi:hypothetical protein
LDLVHTSLRRFGNEYPKTRELLWKHGILATDSPVPAWETVEQAAASKGVWPPGPILDELNAAAGLE